MHVDSEHELSLGLSVLGACSLPQCGQGGAGGWGGELGLGGCFCHHLSVLTPAQFLNISGWEWEVPPR